MRGTRWNYPHRAPLLPLDITSDPFGSQPWEPPRKNLKLVTIPRGQEETEEAGHSRLVDGRFNKQGYLNMRFVLGTYEMNRALYLPTES